MKNRLLLLTLMIACSIQLNAKQKAEVKESVSRMYPHNPATNSVPSFVKEDRFKLNIEPESYDLINDKLIKFEQVMNTTYGIDLLQKPVLKPIKTVDSLFLHPEYFTSIILPPGSEISDVKASFATSGDISYENNTISLRPSKKFITGNLIIFYSNGSRNFHMNIIAKNYTLAECNFDQKNSQFMCMDSSFGIVYSYYNESEVDELEVLLAYCKLVDNDMSSIEKFGFADVRYMGVTYRIQHDNKYGKYFFHDNKYRIAIAR